MHKTMQTYADFEQRPYTTVPCKNKYCITLLKIDNATKEKTAEIMPTAK